MITLLCLPTLTPPQFSCFFPPSPHFLILVFQDHIFQDGLAAVNCQSEFKHIDTVILGKFQGIVIIQGCI